MQLLQVLVQLAIRRRTNIDLARFIKQEFTQTIFVALAQNEFLQEHFLLV